MHHASTWHDNFQRIESIQWRMRSWEEQCAYIVSQGGKDPDTVACEVLNGDWGDGFERIGQLTVAGYDWREIQRRVNEIFRKLHA